MSPWRVAACRDTLEAPVKRTLPGSRHAPAATTDGRYRRTIAVPVIFSCASTSEGTNFSP